MSRWFCNGEPQEQVPIGDRAFQYGDGLFETVAIRAGQPRLWQFHLERLRHGCATLRLTAPDEGDLRRWLDQAICEQESRSADATAKIVVSAGVSGRGYARPTPDRTTVYIGVFPRAEVASAHYREGIDTIVCTTRLALNSVTAGCKTLNRIEQVLARSECVSQGAFEGLTLDAAGRLICGTISNVFIVSDNRVSTPSLERCGVAGVMRRHVIAVLAAHGRAVSVRDIQAAEAMQSDELFVCNSQFGVMPVRSCGDESWQAHPNTRSIMALLAESGIAECAL